MYGSTGYYLEEGLNLTPLGDVMPEDYQQNQNQYAAMQSVMLQQRVHVPVQHYEYDADTVRNNMEWQRQLQRQDVGRSQNMEAARELARQQQQLDAQRNQLEAERRRMFEQQRQHVTPSPVPGLTNQQLDELSATIAARIAGAQQAQPRMTPEQVAAEREALRQQVYGEVVEEIQQDAEVVQQPPVGETFAPDGWTAAPTIKPVVVPVDA